MIAGILMSMNDHGWGNDPNRGGNKGNNQGPPDLEEIWRDFNRRLSGVLGKGGPRGSGDGGVYTTVHDVHRLWDAFFAGRIVPRPWVEEMVRPRSDVPKEKRRYGLGFWLHESTDAVLLEGYDAGVSFWSVRDPGRDLTWTVVANWSDGAWPLVRHLRRALGG